MKLIKLLQVGSFFFSTLALTAAPPMQQSFVILSAGETTNEKYKEWDWRVPVKLLQKQKTWSVMSAKPPLNVQDAIEKATLEIKKMHSNIKSWSIESITLRPIDAERGGSPRDLWFYHIQFIPSDKKEHDSFLEAGLVTSLGLVVLMDHSIIKPEPSKEISREDSIKQAR
jgi:hypothetical protein